MTEIVYIIQTVGVIGKSDVQIYVLDLIMQHIRNVDFVISMEVAEAEQNDCADKLLADKPMLETIIKQQVINLVNKILVDSGKVEYLNSFGINDNFEIKEIFYKAEKRNKITQIT